MTVIATGMMVSKDFIEVAKELEKENISVRVINMSTIKPIDREVMADVRLLKKLKE